MEIRISHTPDPIFENPRLVSIYDAFDGEREDLPHYLVLASEISKEIEKDSKSLNVLDLGCGTGQLAYLLKANGYRVTAVDPALASLEWAQKKPHAQSITWVHGDASVLPSREFDIAFMTGNVAQVFLSDTDWSIALRHIKRSMLAGGHLIFETRNSERKAWTEWNRKNTFTTKNIPGIGKVDGWCEVLNVSADLVRFRWTYVFENDGAVLTSDSTLRFREREEIETPLTRSGFTINSVREAPDRPGKELVFICKTS